MPPVAVETLQRDSAVGVHAADPVDAVDALRATPRANTLFEELGAVCIMGFLLTWTAVGPPVTFLALHAALAHASPWATAWLTLILTLTLAPTGREWPAFRDARVWDAVRRYFQLRLLTPPLPYLAPGERAVFAHYPHSVFPWGSVATRGLPETEPRSGLPKRIRPAVATVLLHTPVLRHVLAWLGCIPATRAAMEAALAGGESVGATPEGIAGIFAGSTRERERVLTSHRGFVKLALRSGVPIVPIFILGQSRALSFAGSKRLSRRVRASIGVWWGRWGLPFLPRKVAMVALVCAPIKVVQDANPSQAVIDATFDRVASEMKTAFDAAKGAVPGWESTQLVFGEE